MKPSDSAEFARIIAEDQPVLVDFFADWCGPCRALAPTLDSLAARYGGQARIAKIDVDAEPELAARYGVQALPTLLLIDRGTVIRQFVGLTSERTLASAIDAQLGDKAA